MPGNAEKKIVKDTSGGNASSFGVSSTNSEMNIENKKQQKTVQNTVVVPFYISKDKKDSKRHTM